MVPLLPHELPVHDLVALVSDEPVQRLDYRVKVETFGYSVDSTLALR